MLDRFDVFYDDNNKCYQIRTKSESYIIEFDDEKKARIFDELIKISDSNNNSFIKIYNQLLKSHDKSKIINVLNTLNDFGLISPEDSLEIAVLNENKSNIKTNISPNSIENLYSDEIIKMEDVRILIIGDSDLTKLINDDFKNRQFKDCNILSAEVISKKSHEEVREIIKDYDFIVLDSTTWSPKASELLNREALELKKPWIYIGGIEDFHIKIGPLFYGDETGCYSCLIKRIKSNHNYASYLDSYEKHLLKNKASSKQDKLIYSDIYYNLIKSYLYLEISKFFELWAVPVTWRGYISINTVNFNLERHDLLKVPFCEECRPQLEYNPAPWLEPISLNL